MSYYNMFSKDMPSSSSSRLVNGNPKFTNVNNYGPESPNQIQNNPRLVNGNPNLINVNNHGPQPGNEIQNDPRLVNGNPNFTIVNNPGPQPRNHIPKNPMLWNSTTAKMNNSSMPLNNGKAILSKSSYGTSHFGNEHRLSHLWSAGKNHGVNLDSNAKSTSLKIVEGTPGTLHGKSNTFLGKKNQETPRFEGSSNSTIFNNGASAKSPVIVEDDCSSVLDKSNLLRGNPRAILGNTFPTNISGNPNKVSSGSIFNNTRGTNKFLLTSGLDIGGKRTSLHLDEPSTPRFSNPIGSFSTSLLGAGTSNNVRPEQQEPVTTSETPEEPKSEWSAKKVGRYLRSIVPFNQQRESVGNNSRNNNNQGKQMKYPNYMKIAVRKFVEEERMSREMACLTILNNNTEPTPTPKRKRHARTNKEIPVPKNENDTNLVPGSSREHSSRYLNKVSTNTDTSLVPGSSREYLNRYLNKVSTNTDTSLVPGSSREHSNRYLNKASTNTDTSLVPGSSREYFNRYYLEKDSTNTDTNLVPDSSREHSNRYYLNKVSTNTDSNLVPGSSREHSNRYLNKFSTNTDTSLVPGSSKEHSYRTKKLETEGGAKETNPQASRHNVEVIIIDDSDDEMIPGGNEDVNGKNIIKETNGSASENCPSGTLDYDTIVSNSLRPMKEEPDLFLDDFDDYPTFSYIQDQEPQNFTHEAMNNAGNSHSVFVSGEENPVLPWEENPNPMESTFNPNPHGDPMEIDGYNLISDNIVSGNNPTPNVENNVSEISPNLSGSRTETGYGGNGSWTGYGEGSSGVTEQGFIGCSNSDKSPINGIFENDGIFPRETENGDEMIYGKDIDNFELDWMISDVQQPTPYDLEWNL